MMKVLIPATYRAVYSNSGEADVVRVKSYTAEMTNREYNVLKELNPKIKCLEQH